MIISKVLKMFVGVFSLLFCFGMALSSTANAQAAVDKQGAIVVVSFGTTYDDSRKACIESVENRIQQAFPDYEVRRAFTSKIVMKRLADRGIHIDSLEQTLDKLKQEGYKNVIVQTTHLTPGEEYDKKVIAVVNKYKEKQVFEQITVGRPLLFSNGNNGSTDDFAALVEALRSQMPILQLKDRAVVFMGHGSPHQPNPVYATMQQKLDAAGLNAVVGVVEETDHPNFQDALKTLKDRNIKRVILMPLMLVAGDHANNDMSGNEPDSWKNLLTKEGIQVDTYLHGLGENSQVQDIYVQHVYDVLHGK